MRQRKGVKMVAEGSYLYDRWLDRLRDPGVLLIVLTLLTVFLLVAFSAVYPEIASAAPLRDEAAASPWQAEEGKLFFRDSAGGFTAAALRSTEVEIDVVGIVADARIRQYFGNDSASRVEGVYAFPLPEDAAVTALRMRVGSRQLEGRIEEKGRAAATYRQARAAGKRTSLLEERKPNIFVVSVANIGPGEEVEIELEYQNVVEYRDGTFSLRFPTVVAPRYTAAVDRTSIGDGLQEQEAVSSAAQGKPVSIVVNLDTGLPLAAIDSPYHSIVVESEGDDRQTVTLDNEWACAGHDFELRWQPERGMGPRSAVFAERSSGSDYLLLLVMPPIGDAMQLQPLPREVQFVLDVSGSMAGASLRQAKEALRLAVSRLDKTDSFDLITFSNRAASLFGGARQATAANKGEAFRFIEGLEAGGGTEMESGLRLALDGERHADRIRQVVFLTDGCVDNEERLSAIIAGRIGDSRLFTVGIGSAPNGYFMKKAAEAGRGTFTYVGSSEEVGERMEALFARLEAPVLTDIDLDLSGISPESFPDPLPDLYIGEPLVVVLRAAELPDSLTLQGIFAGRKWEQVLDPRYSSFQKGISTLWARRKIAALMAELQAGVRQEEEVRSEVLALALEHHLLSKYTGLVVVDEASAAQPAATPLPRSLSEVSSSALLSGLPRTGTVAEFCLVLGAMSILLSTLLFRLFLRLKAKEVGK